MMQETKEIFEKVCYSKQQTDEYISLFEKKISNELAHMSEKHERKAREISKLLDPYQKHHKIRHKEIASSFEHLTTLARYDHEQQRLKLTEHVGDQDARKNYMLNIDGHLSISGAPYDVEWTNGAIAYAHKNNGEFGISPMNGYAAAGLGIFMNPITPPGEDIIARITAYMPISYSWFNWIINSGYTSTHGGVGVLIYDLNDGSVVIDNRSKPELWNASRSEPGLSSEQDIETYLGFTSAAETYFVMRSGHSYLTWLWCWGGTYFSGDTCLSMASMACKLPFVVVKPWLSI